MTSHSPDNKQPQSSPNSDESYTEERFTVDDKQGLREALERLRARTQTMDEAVSGVIPDDNDYDEPTATSSNEDGTGAEKLFVSWANNHILDVVVEDQDTAIVDVSDLLNQSQSYASQPDGENDEPVNRKSIVLSLPPQPQPSVRQAILDEEQTTPWTLEQFFNGEINLDAELAQRFEQMPTLTNARFRTLGPQPGRRIATLGAQDSAASLTIDVDTRTQATQLSFTLGSMMTLRFQLYNLSSMDRERWLELMQRPEDGLAILWGPARWRDDYLICTSQQAYTSIYAFSKNNFEAAIRMTPSVTRDLLNWLDEVWQQTQQDDNQEPPMLTW